MIWKFCKMNFFQDHENILNVLMKWSVFLNIFCLIMNIHRAADAVCFASDLLWAFLLNFWLSWRGESKYVALEFPSESCFRLPPWMVVVKVWPSW